MIVALVAFLGFATNLELPQFDTDPVKSADVSRESLILLDLTEALVLDPSPQPTKEGKEGMDMVEWSVEYFLPVQMLNYAMNKQEVVSVSGAMNNQKLEEAYIKGIPRVKSRSSETIKTVGQQVIYHYHPCAILYFLPFMIAFAFIVIFKTRPSDRKSVTVIDVPPISISQK
jgi:hypothetical protein